MNIAMNRARSLLKIELVLGVVDSWLSMRSPTPDGPVVTVDTQNSYGNKGKRYE